MRTIALRRRVTAEERRALQELARAAPLGGERAARAGIVLSVLDGTHPAAVARQAGLPRTTVYSWIRRFASGGIAGLDNQPCHDRAVLGAR